MYALRRQLSQLDVNLRGYSRAKIQEEYATLDYPGDSDLIVGAFVFGTIDEVLTPLKASALYVGMTYLPPLAFFQTTGVDDKALAAFERQLKGEPAALAVAE